jgi:hypothetical protein
MRAAELAAGALSELLKLLWDVSHANLCLLPGMLRLSPDARGKVLDDFARARRHFRFTLAVKASFWRQLPWQLFGLSHHDAEVARVCAQRCLELFDASLSQVKNHWLVDGLCRPGSPGFHQVQQFVAGSQLVELPLLEGLVARFKFVSVVERWIEGRHAVVKQIFRTAPNASALHLGFMLSLPHVKSLLLRAEPGLLETLGNHCINMKTSWKALRMLGLWHHPGVQALLTSLGNKRSLSREGRAKIVEIIFHVDGPTLMQTMAPLEDPPDNPPVPPAPDVAAGPVLVAGVGEEQPPAHGGPVLDVEPPPFA